MIVVKKSGFGVIDQDSKFCSLRALNFFYEKGNSEFNMGQKLKNTLITLETGADVARTSARCRRQWGSNLMYVLYEVRLGKTDQ